MANSNSPAAPPAWLENAAKTEAPADDRVALTPAARNSIPLNDAKPASRLGAAPPAAPKTKEETEISSRRCDRTTLLPSSIVLVLISFAFLRYLLPIVTARFLPELIYAPLAALWIGLIVRAAYPLFAYRYRLTSQRLYRRRGLLYPRDEPLELATVGRVEVRRTWVQILLGVGDVVAMPEESSGRPPVDCVGIRAPKKFAALLESTAAAARNATVTATEKPVSSRRDTRAPG